MKNENNYKISVIVPVYNGEKYLEKTLQSILASTEKSIQVILINDGSKDDSSRICEEFQKKHQNITYFQKKNEGIVATRNKGLELVEGEYICFCDQDDLVENTCYEKMLSKMEIEQCDVVMCGTARYINENEIVPLETFKDEIWDDEKIKEEVVKPVLFYGSDLGKPPIERRVGTIWKCMVKSEVVKNNNIRFRRYVDYEDDLLFFLDVMMYAKKVATLSYVGYFWRVNLKSETYNWKYIQNFYMKYKLLINDVASMLYKADYNYEDIENYKKYQMCTLYENYIVNEGSAFNNISFFEKNEHIKKDILNDEFKHNISFRKHINKSSIRKRITLTFLAYRLVGCAYLFATSYKKIREYAICSRHWFVIEQLIKKKEKRK